MTALLYRVTLELLTFIGARRRRQPLKAVHTLAAIIKLLLQGVHL